MTETPNRTVAVIDIGATAVRMVIAEIDEPGRFKTLESLRKAVPLGKESFTQGRIRQATIQTCIEILKGYQQVMREYGIDDPSRILAVATSSVREAQNSENFRDRIDIATGIALKVIDEAEQGRLTFMAARDVLELRPELAGEDVLFCEVGGGNTEILLIRRGQMAFSNSYRLGTLRMRESLETYLKPRERIRKILAQHIGRTSETIKREVPSPSNPVFVAMGGDVRFAAAQLAPDWAETRLARIDLDAFSAFVDKILPLAVDKIVARYKISYEEAETVGPGLFANLILARAFESKVLVIPRTSFRDGLLRDLAFQRPWTDAFSEEVVRSAVALGRKYEFDEKHARLVSDLAVRIFRALQKTYRLDPRHELLLRIAGLLHEIGNFIGSRSHHKHSYYLILNSDIFGLTRREAALVALISRYHRRALPSLNHPEFAVLDRDTRLTVSKKAAILRVADALDRNHLQQARDIDVSLSKDEMTITVTGIEDLTMERLALKEKGSLFEDVYGLSVALREGR